MKSIFILLSACFLAVLLSLPLPATAQDLSDQQSALQNALTNNDADRALVLAEALYEQAQSTDSHGVAGYAAYIRAGLLDHQGDTAGAAKSFDDCDHHYERTGSIAQSLQCGYQAGQAWLKANRKTRSIRTFENIAERLEEIEQNRSALASQIYLTLAEEIMPPKLDGSPRAQMLREKAVGYAQNAILAMKASGQDESEALPAAFFVKGLAHEDAEEFEAAAEAYEEAIRLYQNLPNQTEDNLIKMQARLRVAEAVSRDETTPNTMEATHIDGQTVIVEIKRKKRVKFPRLGGNRLVDGAQAQVRITLSESGEPAEVEIVASMPSPEFGEALQKAIRTWTFSPPEGISPLDIEPFDYSMTFWVERLR